MKTVYIVLLAILGFFLIIFLWVKGIYNNIVTQDEAVTAQWHQVETQYQRRMDLIPNLVTVAQNYANFEKATLTEVTQLRASAGQANVTWNAQGSTVDQKIQASQQMESTLSRLLVIIEKYPDLKAGEQFSKVMTELEGTENRVSFERHKFNDVAQDYNTYIRRFPQNIFAGMFNFQTRAYFEADQGASKAPVIQPNKE